MLESIAMEIIEISIGSCIINERTSEMEIDDNMIYVGDFSTKLSNIVNLQVQTNHNLNLIEFEGLMYNPSYDHNELTFYSAGDHKGIVKPYSDDTQELKDKYEAILNFYLSKPVEYTSIINIKFSTISGGQDFTDTIKIDSIGDFEDIDKHLLTKKSEYQKDYTQRVFNKIDKQFI